MVICRNAEGVRGKRKVGTLDLAILEQPLEAFF